jgi:hypothetical protein
MLRFAPARHADLPNSSAPTSGAEPPYPLVYGESVAPSSIAGEFDLSEKSPSPAFVNRALVSE